MKAHDAHHWTLSSCFGAFLSVRVHLGPFRYCKKTRHSGAINAKVHATMSCQNFSQDAPDPYHWTLVSCFGAFLSVWVHLEPFRYCTKLAAKCAKLVQLMQKFVPRSRVGIFHNDAPDPYHWTPNSCFAAFLAIWVHL